jgi:hypothetical protein
MSSILSLSKPKEHYFANPADAPISSNIQKSISYNELLGNICSNECKTIEFPLTRFLSYKNNVGYLTLNRNVLSYILGENMMNLMLSFIIRKHDKCPIINPQLLDKHTEFKVEINDDYVHTGTINLFKITDLLGFISEVDGRKIFPVRFAPYSNINFIVTIPFLGHKSVYDFITVELSSDTVQFSEELSKRVTTERIDVPLNNNKLLSFSKGFITMIEKEVKEIDFTLDGTENKNEAIKYDPSLKGKGVDIMIGKHRGFRFTDPKCNNSDWLVRPLVLHNYVFSGIECQDYFNSASLVYNEVNSFTFCCYIPKERTKTLMFSLNRNADVFSKVKFLYDGKQCELLKHPRIVHENVVYPINFDKDDINVVSLLYRGYLWLDIENDSIENNDVGAFLEKLSVTYDKLFLNTFERRQLAQSVVPLFKFIETEFKK